MKDLPPVHNKRSLEQWKIISKHVDFRGKTVLDLGCGYGDLLYRAKQAGAYCKGIDNNSDIVKYLSSPLDGLDVVSLDLDYDLSGAHSAYDIIICFSVLPYLKKPFEILKWIKDHSEIALLELQYFGDGPGLASMENDNDAKAILKYIGWQSIEPIGKTLVEDRQKYRTIWRCE